MSQKSAGLKSSNLYRRLVEMSKLLVIGAHPADPFDLAGGTIYQFNNLKQSTTILSITDGTRSHFDESFDVGDVSKAVIKRREFSQASCLVGACGKSTVFSYPDEPLKESYSSCIDQLVRYIRNIKPSIVITHHPNEYSHWDHAACGRSVCRALKAAKKLEGEKHWVPMVYFFGVQFRPETVRIGLIPQAPDLLINLEKKTVVKKIETMLCFKSQGMTKAKLIQRMNSFEGETGRADGLRWSESFTFYYPLKRNTLLYNNMF
ncbi:MAG: hypothetical protein FVQ80_06795 [Planctomycetes bacterium]|nr:hypothetical protein [Planctomycetota bacterium]